MFWLMMFGPAESSCVSLSLVIIFRVDCPGRKRPQRRNLTFTRLLSFSPWWSLMVLKESRWFLLAFCSTILTVNEYQRCWVLLFSFVRRACVILGVIFILSSLCILGKAIHDLATKLLPEVVRIHRPAAQTPGLNRAKRKKLHENELMCTENFHMLYISEQEKTLNVVQGWEFDSN